MPFDSDKQRRFLWSQKPEVAKKIAHKQSGGGVYDDKLYDSAARWWNARMAGVPQHVGFKDDPDFITETAATNPDDPYGNRFVNPYRVPPSDRYTDLATYYTAGDRKLGRGAAERARMSIANERIKREAEFKRGFKFNQGGEVPMMDGRKPKKVIQKDRYGNQVTFEYESDTKPLDPTAIIKAQMEQMAEVPEMMEVPHPGSPQGTDTVPAWLTPGEFVVNAEAMRIPGVEEQVTQMNNMGRAIQQAQGGSIPHMYQQGGMVDDAMDFAGPEILTDEQIRAKMEAARAAMPPDAPVSMPTPPPWAGRPEGLTNLLHEREGFRDDVYLDTEGKPTVGYGHLLPQEYIEREGERPFDQQQLERWFDEDSAAATPAAVRNVGRKTWVGLNDQQKSALASMAFQLGEAGQGKFENMLDAIRRGDNAAVQREAKDSKWYEQTPTRVEDIIAAFPVNRAGGGPIYAYRGIDTAMQDAYDIEDPNADLSSGWVPPVYGMDEISPMEQSILDQEAAPTESEYQQRLAQQIAMADNMVAGGDGDDLGTVGAPPPAEQPMPWEEAWDWITDTSVADERNADFNRKAAAANLDNANETVAELEARVEAGQPVNSHTLEAAQAAQDHQVDEVIEAEQEYAAVADYDMQAEYEEAAGIEAFHERIAEGNEPGSEDDETTLNELAESPEFEEEDDPSKESDKGTQTPDEVVAQGEQAAKQDPAMLDKAKGFFKGAFSDLFDGQELARMAIMYLGSRALGYSHGGSLNWAAKQYVQRLDAKHAGRAQNAKEFTKSGKYTPKSIAQYQKTGDLSVLQPVGATQTITGNTMTRTIGGKKVVFQEVKIGDNTMYVGPDGTPRSAAAIEGGSQPYEAAFEKGTPEYRARRSRATGDAAGRFEEVWKAEDTIPGGRDKPASHFTKIRPKQAADEFWAWSESMGLDPESDEALQIMTNAYRQAIADGKGGDVKPTSLKPYLQQEHIRELSGAPELFATNPDRDVGEAAKYVRGDKMASLDRNIQAVASALPGLKGLHPKDAKDRFYQLAVGEWNDLDPEIKKKYNKSATDDESGFYVFMNKRAAELLNKSGG